MGQNVAYVTLNYFQAPGDHLSFEELSLKLHLFVELFSSADQYTCIICACQCLCISDVVITYLLLSNTINFHTFCSLCLLILDRLRCRYLLQILEMQTPK